MESNTVYTYDVYNDKHEVNKDDLKISIHVYGIAIKDGKILISPQYDGYDFPGGTAEKGETHLETLIREFKEETGYIVEPVKLLNVYTSFFHHLKRSQNYQSYMIFYLVNIIDGNICDDGFDEDEREYAKLAKWVDISELKNMRHACSMNISEEIIKKALSN